MVRRITASNDHQSTAQLANPDTLTDNELVNILSEYQTRITDTEQILYELDTVQAQVQEILDNRAVGNNQIPPSDQMPPFNFEIPSDSLSSSDFGFILDEIPSPSPLPATNEMSTIEQTPTSRRQPPRRASQVWYGNVGLVRYN